MSVTVVHPAVGEVVHAEDVNGLYNGTTLLTVSFALIAASTSGAHEVVALVAGKSIRVLALYLNSTGIVNVKFQSHVTPTDLTGLYYCVAQTQITLPFIKTGLFQTKAGEALDISLSASIGVGGHLVYVTI